MPSEIKEYIHSYLDLSKESEIILNNGNFKDYITDIAELIHENKLNKTNLKNILAEYSIENIDDIKLDLLHLLLAYIEIILDTHSITEKDRYNIETLKLYFKIKEGDFHKYCYGKIRFLCQEQFARLYLDNDISFDEAVFRVEMQSIFDLSYAQMDEFKQDEIIRALREGASILNLDTDKFPKKFDPGSA